MSLAARKAVYIKAHLCAHSVQSREPFHSFPLISRCGIRALEAITVPVCPSNRLLTSAITDIQKLSPGKAKHCSPDDLYPPKGSSTGLML